MGELERPGSVVLFTDSAFVGNPCSERPTAVRDQFPAMVAPLAGRLSKLTIAARCQEGTGSATSGEALDLGSSLAFRGLPYYANTEAFWKRAPVVYTRSRPILQDLIREHDVVVLRVHHALGPVIAGMARRQRKPLLVYWAGPPIIDSVRANYDPASARGRAALTAARLEEGWERRLARIADWNCFVDRRQHTSLGAPPRVTWVLPNLVREDDLVRDVAKRDEGAALELVFVGRLYRHKGIFDLVRAVRASDRPISLTFVGTGPDEDELRKTIGDLGLTERVRAVGARDHAGVMASLRSAHALVLPSYGEGLPKVLWEAWASGTAVVMSRTGDVTRHVRHGENGYLVEPGDVGGLTRQLDALWDDEPSRRRVATAGLSVARDHTWSDFLERMLEGIGAARAFWRDAHPGA